MEPFPPSNEVLALWRSIVTRLWSVSENRWRWMAPLSRPALVDPYGTNKRAVCSSVSSSDKSMNNKLSKQRLFFFFCRLNNNELWIQKSWCSCNIRHSSYLYQPSHFSIHKVQLSDTRRSFFHYFWFWFIVFSSVMQQQESITALDWHSIKNLIFPSINSEKNTSPHRQYSPPININDYVFNAKHLSVYIAYHLSCVHISKMFKSFQLSSGNRVVCW